MTTSKGARMPIRTPAVLASTALLGLGLSACGGSGGGGKPVAEVKDVPAGTTYVKLAPGFVKALGQLGLAPAPIGGAGLSGGSLRVPITDGVLRYFKPGTKDPFVQGQLQHDGSGLSLTAGKKRVALSDFVIDPGKSTLTGTVTVNGKVAKKKAQLFFLDGRTLKPLRAVKRGAVLEGTTVELKSSAAKLLNTTFKTKALKGGLKIGTAKIVVQTKL